MAGAKRTCEDELETMKNKRPRHVSPARLRRWLLLRGNHCPNLISMVAIDSMTFWHGAFEATVRWIPTTSTLDTNLRILEEKGNEIASSVVSQLIGLMDAFVSMPIPGIGDF